MYTKKNTKNLNELSLLHTEKGKKKVWTTVVEHSIRVKSRWICWHYSPERSIKWSVPADEWTRCEEHEPEYGQTKVHPTFWVHKEPGHAAHQISKQCTGVNWGKSTERRGKNMTDHCRCDCGTFIANVPREFCHCISILYKFGKRISEYTLRTHTEEAVTLVVRVLKATAVCRTVGWWVGGFYTPVWNMTGCSAVRADDNISVSLICMTFCASIRRCAVKKWETKLYLKTTSKRSSDQAAVSGHMTAPCALIMWPLNATWSHSFPWNA